MSRFGEDGQTPFHRACSKGHKSMVTLMVDAGVSVNFRSRGEETCLMLAARANGTETVDFLINRGARTDAQNRDGDTALHYVLFGVECNYILIGNYGYEVELVLEIGKQMEET